MATLPNLSALALTGAPKDADFQRRLRERQKAAAKAAKEAAAKAAKPKPSKRATPSATPSVPSMRIPDWDDIDDLLEHDDRARKSVEEILRDLLTRQSAATPPTPPTPQPAQPAQPAQSPDDAIDSPPPSPRREDATWFRKFREEFRAEVLEREKRQRDIREAKRLEREREGAAARAAAKAREDERERRRAEARAARAAELARVRREGGGLVGPDALALEEELDRLN